MEPGTGIWSYLPSMEGEHGLSAGLVQLGHYRFSQLLLLLPYLRTVLASFPLSLSIFLGFLHPVLWHVSIHCGPGHSVALPDSLPLPGLFDTGLQSPFSFFLTSTPPSLHSQNKVFLSPSSFSDHHFVLFGHFSPYSHLRGCFPSLYHRTVTFLPPVPFNDLCWASTASSTSHHGHHLQMHRNLQLRPSCAILETNLRAPSRYQQPWWPQQLWL
jgi:hypothetical protein